MGVEFCGFGAGVVPHRQKTLVEVMGEALLPGGKGGVEPKTPTVFNLELFCLAPKRRNLESPQAAARWRFLKAISE